VYSVLRFDERLTADSVGDNDAWGIGSGPLEGIMKQMIEKLAS